MPESLRITADVNLAGKWLHVSAHRIELAVEVPKPFVAWVIDDRTLATWIADNRYRLTAQVELDGTRMFVHIGNAMRTLMVDPEIATALAARQLKLEQMLRQNSVEEASAVAGAAIQEELFA